MDSNQQFGKPVLIAVSLVLALILLLALGIITGGLGLVLATPILAVVMVVVQTVYIEGVLGDKNTEVEKKDLDGEDEGKSKKAKESRKKRLTRFKIFNFWILLLLFYFLLFTL
ncbi:MAG TPA: hypothetical protein VGC76_17540 [Pyrinomonadaceae bacterium]|jgi:predicted PurR-regulated permease PerM